MAVSFTAIDFETANASAASACSVGVVKVVDDRVVHREHWLIKPPFGHDLFNEWNVRIHGIEPHMVADAAEWPEVAAEVFAVVGTDPLVAHNAGFDMNVIRSISDATGAPVPDLTYACSLQLARRTYDLDSYRLPAVAMAAGFEDFAHHDALADAAACAAIVVHAGRRHDADDLAHLALIAGIGLKPLRKERAADEATRSRPMALR